MKTISSTTKNIFLFIALFSLVGCTPAIVAAPTVDPLFCASTVAVAKTEAVQSVYTSLTQNAVPTQNIAAATKTNVPIPTLIPTKVPTNTVVVIQKPTISPTPSAYQCLITKLDPKLGTNLAIGADFDLTVTLKNTGTEKWSSANIDFKYLNGAEFQKTADLVDLPVDVAPGDSVDLIVDMTSKTETGTQNAAWGLVRSSTTFCQVDLQIFVK